MTTVYTTDELLQTLAFVGGQWIEADDKKTFSVLNPATQEQLADVPDMGQADIQKAIETAHATLKEWGSRTAKDRKKVLSTWAELVRLNAEPLAEILTKEMGKSLAAAKGEVISSANYIEWNANECLRINGELLPANVPGNFEYVKKRPVGVVGAITPWNFPSSMIARKVAPALAAGCTVVIKPAEDTPLSALAIAKLAEDAGLPAGALNVVTASHGADVGQELCANTLVKKISFTGSTAVGKILSRQSADTVKKISMELGGNAPFVVFEDADLDKAVQGALGIKYINSGQTCICANRLLVHNDIKEEFTEKLNAALDQLTLGDGLEEGVTHGPLINKKAIDKVGSLVQGAIDQGANVVRGGSVNKEYGGNFYDFTVLSGLNREMDIFKNEIFGPVAAVYGFDTEAEAVEMANDTNYGLAAYVYSEDTGRLIRVSDQLEYGMVGANTISFVNEVMPFGGVKESGIGREGSIHGVDEFLEMHYVCISQ